MKYYTNQIALFVLFILSTCLAFAQEFPVVDTGDALMFIFQNVGGFKGASTIGIMFLAAQMLMKLFGTPLVNANSWSAKTKFVIYAVLHLVLTIGPTMIAGASFSAAALSGSFLLLVSQYGYRAYELFIEKKDPAKTSATGSK